MNIQEWAKIHCRDIIERANNSKLFDDLADFPYDDIIEGEDGGKVRAVYTNSGYIPIVDIIGLARDDFAKAYPTEDQLDAYDRYISMFTIIEGADVLNQVRNAIARETERMDLMKIELPV